MTTDATTSQDTNKDGGRENSASVLQRIVPLSKLSHSGINWRSPTDYGFAKSRKAVPLSLNEVPQAAAELPIVFLDSSFGLVPFALLSVDEQNDVSFVTGDGMFRATYVPFMLRAHPFCVAASETSKIVAATDPSGGCLTASTGANAFFSEDGNLHQDVVPIVSKLNAWVHELNKAKQATQFLIENKLLVDAGNRVWQAPSDAKLTDICDNHEGFVTSGAAALYYGHLVSLRNIAKLRARKEMRVAQTAAEHSVARRDDSGEEMIDLVSEAMNNTSLIDDLL